VIPRRSYRVTSEELLSDSFDSHDLLVFLGHSPVDVFKEFTKRYPEALGEG